MIGQWVLPLIGRGRIGERAGHGAGLWASWPCPQMGPGEVGQPAPTWIGVGSWLGGGAAGQSGWWGLIGSGADHGEGLWAVGQLALPPNGVMGADQGPRGEAMGGWLALPCP